MKLIYIFCLAAFAGTNLTAFADEAVCAKDAMSLRQTPNLKAPITWRVTRNMPFIRVEKKQDWSKIKDCDGAVYWAKSAELTSKIRCVVVIRDVASLHASAKGSAPANDFSTLDRYTPLRRVSDLRDWIQVEDEAGRLAWINQNQVWKPTPRGSHKI